MCIRDRNTETWSITVHNSQRTCRRWLTILGSEWRWRVYNSTYDIHHTYKCFLWESMNTLHCPTFKSGTSSHCKIYHTVNRLRSFLSSCHPVIWSFDHSVTWLLELEECKIGCLHTWGSYMVPGLQSLHENAAYSVEPMEGPFLAASALQYCFLQSSAKPEPWHWSIASCRPSTRVRRKRNMATRARVLQGLIG